jgi:hypothetical protein
MLTPIRIRLKDETPSTAVAAPLARFDDDRKPPQRSDFRLLPGDRFLNYIAQSLLLITSIAVGCR